MPQYSTESNYFKYAEKTQLIQTNLVATCTTMSIETCMKPSASTQIDSRAAFLASSSPRGPLKLDQPTNTCDNNFPLTFTVAGIC